MNKFFALAVLAFVCASASANEEIDDGMSEFAVVTSDAEETQNVPEDLKAFEDFCISSRDWVLSDIKHNTNSMTANVFRIFFNSVEALGHESMENQKVATEKLSKQLANPETAIEQGGNRVSQIIAEGQQKMQGQSVPMALITAFKTAFTATSSSVGAYVNDKLDVLKKMGSVEQIGSGLAEACAKVKYYEDELKSQLEEYKKASLNGDEKYANVNLDQVKCTSARRLTQIEGGCGFANTLKPIVQRFMTGN